MLRRDLQCWLGWLMLTTKGKWENYTIIEVKKSMLER